jgi:MYXO-CTERM domain-containing protein
VKFIVPIMKQTFTTHRRAAALLLAAAALPLTPLLAQETTSAPPSDPVVEPIDVVREPVVITPPAAPRVTAPTVQTTTPAEETVDTTPPPARTTTRATTRTTVRATAPARRVAAPVAAAPIAAAPAPAPAAEATVAEPVETLPVETLPVETLPAETAPVATVGETESGGGSIWPWLLGGLALAALAFALLRRRRRAEVYDRVYEAPAAPVAAEPEFVAPIAAAPLAAAPSDGPDPVLAAGAAAAAAAAEPAGRPWIDLQLKPRRAGVGDDGAVVEFELALANNGSAPAEDVRVSAWMLAAGSPQESEMERALIERPADAALPEVALDAGQAKSVEASVALPVSGLDDAVLPVVVAEARYRLPGGGEGRTAAAYAVGVPDGDDMAYFDVEHPSGLHEDVEARLRGESERV